VSSLVKEKFEINHSNEDWKSFKSSINGDIDKLQKARSSSFVITTSLKYLCQFGMFGNMPYSHNINIEV